MKRTSRASRKDKSAARMARSRIEFSAAATKPPSILSQFAGRARKYRIEAAPAPTSSKQTGWPRVFSSVNRLSAKAKSYMSQLSVSSMTNLVGEASSAVRQARTEPLKAVLSTEAPERLMAMPVPVGSSLRTKIAWANMDKSKSRITPESSAGRSTPSVSPSWSKRTSHS